jgi:hemerythrin-like domain-containing protein
MKRATENLEDDHVYILRLTDVMEKISTSGEDPDISELQSIVSIIRNFADGIHHAKEEKVFFPRLGEKGFSSDMGPVRVMLNEHVAGRNFVKFMAESIALYEKGDKNALRQVYSNMLGYASLLKSHIAKENNILFRMADRVLDENENAWILKEFEEHEKDHFSREKLVKEIERLEDIYGF